MNVHEKTLKSLADALETIAKVLKEIASSPVPSSPEAAASGLPDGSEMEWARASTLARRYDFANEKGIIPILYRGVKEKAIKKLGGQNPDGTRGAVTVFNVSDVAAYMWKTRGEKEK